ncbi:MAG TPA: response regulator transcription factor [Solirubrobacteraceae bacterium]|nr:response regulator transcription factor [Solirubrobacteraceae bacterium]
MSAEGPRILLAEGDRPTRAGLRVAVRRAGFELVDEAGSLAEALAMASKQSPDAALIAADLPGGGTEAARRLVSLYPRVRVIVLSSELSGDELLEAVLAGAAGYLAKDMSLDRLPHAIQGVLAGEVALPRLHADTLLAELRRRDAARERIAARTGASLTDREWEVLQLLGEGASTATMAERLRISQVTARRHISTLLAKLGVGDRESAARLASRSSD